MTFLINPFMVSPPPAAGVSFVNASTFTHSGTSTNFTLPSGSQTGDLVVVSCFADFGANVSTSSSGGSWTQLVPGGGAGGVCVNYRLINSTDISGSFSTTTSSSSFGRAVSVTVYNGVTTIVDRGYVNSTTHGGFVKNTSGSSVVTLFATFSSDANPTEPAGFTERTHASVFDNSQYRVSSSADQLSGYVNSTSIVLSPGGTNPSIRALEIY